MNRMEGSLPERGAVELVPAARFDFAALAALFTRGYEGYFVPIHVDAAAFEGVVRSGDIVLEASRVALADGRPVGVGILGVRGRRGWVGGVGVVPERRGRGDGRALMNALIAEARDRGVEHLTLEVLVQNTPAIPLYESLGFRDVRVLDTLVRGPEAPPAGAPAATEALPLDRALALGDRWEATPAPWQRESRSIERAPAGLEAGAWTVDGAPAACVIYRVRSGQLSIALACAAGPDRIAGIHALLHALLAAHPGSGLQIINLAAGDPASEALRALGARVTLQQREMALDLAARG